MASLESRWDWQARPDRRVGWFGSAWERGRARCATRVRMTTKGDTGCCSSGSRNGKGAKVLTSSSMTVGCAWNSRPRLAFRAVVLQLIDCCQSETVFLDTVRERYCMELQRNETNDYLLDGVDEGDEEEELDDLEDPVCVRRS